MESTRSRSAKLAYNDLWTEKNILHLPVELRKTLKEPFGDIISEGEVKSLLKACDVIVTVGDICTLTLHRLGFAPRLAIVDFATKRESLTELKERIQEVGDVAVSVENPAGTITKMLWDAVYSAFQQDANMRIEVAGEEDLALLPCVLFAPKGAKVIYGQPDVGLVLVRPTDELKQTVKDIIYAMKGA